MTNSPVICRSRAQTQLQHLTSVTPDASFSVSGTAVWRLRATPCSVINAKRTENVFLRILIYSAIALDVSALHALFTAICHAIPKRFLPTPTGPHASFLGNCRR